MTQSKQVLFFFSINMDVSAPADPCFGLVGGLGSPSQSHTEFYFSDFISKLSFQLHKLLLRVFESNWYFSEFIAFH